MGGNGVERDLEIEGGGVTMIMANDYGKQQESEDNTSESESFLREPLLLKNNRMNNTSQLAIVGANVCPIESLDYEYSSYPVSFSSFCSEFPCKVSFGFSVN